MEDRCKRCRRITKLKQSQKHLLELLHESRDVLYHYDLTADCFLYISPSIESLTGYTAEEFLASGGTLYREVIHPEDRLMYLALEEALKTNQNQSTDINAECRICHKQDGRYIWVSDRIRVLRRKNGSAKAVVGSLRDITYRKKVHQLLEESESIFRSLFDHAPIALFRSRISDGKLLEVNEQFWQLFGYPSRDECLKDNAFSHHIPPEERKRRIEILAQKKQIQGQEVELKRADGTIFWEEISARILPKKDYLEGAVRDISVSKSLSAIEKQVLGLVLEGKSNREIAKAMHRAIRTIEDHRAHIMRKLHAHNLIELVQKAQLPTTF